MFTNRQVQQYGLLIGDNNPIHSTVDCQNSSSSKVIVHGMLSASIFSSIFGTLIPGSIYRSQTISFHSPVYSNEYLIGRVQVTHVKDLRKKGLLVTCDTAVYQNDLGCETKKVNEGGIEGMLQCVNGSAEVWLPGLLKL